MVAKLTDVAELAGVSPTTVSRVINNKGYLSEKTKQKVQEAMRTLGYKPNNLARGLQGKSAQLIGLIFPNISNIFYSELIEYLEIELFKHGYKTIICNSENDPAHSSPERFSMSERLRESILTLRLQRKRSSKCSTACGQTRVPEEHPRRRPELTDRLEWLPNPGAFF